MINQDYQAQLRRWYHFINKKRVRIP